MNSIKQKAAEVRDNLIKSNSNSRQERLQKIISRFTNDFKEVTQELIECGVNYAPCFWYRSENDGEYHNYPPTLKLDLSRNGGSGGICVSDSILFTFIHDGIERKKRIFYNKENGWHYIGRSGLCINKCISISGRKDLILYLDSYIEGEYK